MFVDVNVFITILIYGLWEALDRLKIDVTVLGTLPDIGKFIRKAVTSRHLFDLSWSEWFPRTGCFVPGRDGVGVGQDFIILPAPSLTNIR